MSNAASPSRRDGVNATAREQRHREEACRIVAHRGASLLRHENTLEAFELAIEYGTDYVELDVRRTGDGCLIVHHDPDVNQLPVASNPFEVLKASARSGGYLLATLEDVLKACRGRIKLDVELKEEGYEEDVVRSVRRILSDREYVITSFSDLSLQRIKRHFRSVRCGLLLGRANPPRRFLTRWREFFPVHRACEIGADFVVSHHKLLRFGFSRRLRANGFPLWVWTVDDPGLIQKLLGDLSVEAIITNVPDVALAARSQMTERNRSK